MQDDDLFIMGDSYGYRGRFEELIHHWIPDKERLILVGNMIGKGEDSAGMLKFAKRLSSEYGAVILGGLQEYLFYRWLSDPTQKPIPYYNRSGREIIESFFEPGVTKRKTPESLVQELAYNYFELINFVQDLPHYVEAGKYLIVPAGLSLSVSDWKLTNPHDFRQGHASFHDGVNKTGKIIVFGGLPPRILHKAETFEPWISPCKTKIGINGDASNNGLIHALQIQKSEHHFYSA